MELLNLHSARLGEAREANRFILNQAVEDDNEPEAQINMAMIENEIDETTYKTSIYPLIRLTDA